MLEQQVFEDEDENLEKDVTPITESRWKGDDEVYVFTTETLDMRMDGPDKIMSKTLNTNSNSGAWG